MALVKEIDYGTPAVARRTNAGHPDHRRRDGHACPRAPRSCARRWMPASRCRSSAPPTASRPSAPAACAWSRSRAAPARPPPAPRRSRRAWWCHTQTERLKQLRRGVMELYISDHPLDCLTCAANGDCELQDMAGAVGLREVRYGYEGENHLTAAEGRVQPLFHLRSVQVHRLLALRARLRGGAGHLRADHRRARLRLQGSPPAWTSRSWSPNASPAAPACRPARPRR